MQKDISQITETLKALRKKYNFSQEKIADLLSIEQSSYARIENGINRLDVRKAAILADLYKEDISIWDLLPIEKPIIQQGNYNSNISVYASEMIVNHEKFCDQLKSEIDFLKNELSNLKSQYNKLLQKLLDLK